MKRLRFLMVTGFFLAALAWVSHAQAVNWQELLGRPQPKATKVFHYGPAPDQFAELWEPGGTGHFPVVILMHGGCWQESVGGVELMAGLAEDLRKRGIAVWNVEYRREGAEGAGYPGTFLDVADAVDDLQNIGIDYGLDLAHVVALGHSAGGQLALWAAARGNLKHDSAVYRKPRQKIKAVISLAGINDLAAYRDNGPSACGVPESVDALVSHNGKNSYGDTSPAAMLPLYVPQLVVSGTDDDIVPPDFGIAYADAAAKAGDKVETLMIKGAGHFDLIDPDSGAWAQIRSRLETYLK